MAENIRESDTTERLINERTSQLVNECKRQSESCLYTSTTLYIWLREARCIRRIFVVSPIIFGTLATWSVLDQPNETWLQWLTAICALFAGLFPAIFEALELNTHVENITRQAALFKSLQDRFRQASTGAALGPFKDFQKEFNTLMDRMDEARMQSITPPERCFKSAQKKIKKGHYEFSTDVI